MSTTTQQAIAQRNDRQAQQANSLRNFITRLTPEIQRALPKGMDGDRIARIALTLLRTDMLACNAKGKPGNALINCTEESFAGALLTSAALGLEVGLNGEAYLVNYSGECTLIVGYQGLAKLYYQHPMARTLDAQCVYANDDFDYAYGLTPFLKHKPARGERGAIVEYYACATLSTGASAFVVLSVDEVKALRGGKTGTSGGIADPMHWMQRKTALRQLFKLLPKTATLSKALEADEKTGSALYTDQLSMSTPAPALPAATEAPIVETEDAGTVDMTTGEVFEGEVEDPDEPAWPTTAQVPA
jgi:recombination protein RecT